ncbi:MAG: tetratricopeptide repeat protein [Aureliella sp.]
MWLLVTVALVSCSVFALARIAPIYLPRPAPPEESQALDDSDWDAAMADLDRHQSATAVSFLRDSAGDESRQAQRAVLQGRLFLDQGQLFAARQTLLEGLGESKIAPLATYWLGAVSYALSDSRTAEQYWLDALQANPLHVDTHRSLAMIYYDRGAIDHAVQHLKEVARLAPTDARPYRLLGLIHKDYEQYSEAAEFYRQAQSRGLTDATQQQVSIELAEALIKTRNYQAGLDSLQRAIATPDAQVLLAECLIGLGDSEAAAEILDKVLESEPDHFAALSERAGVYLEQQQATQAIELLQRAVKLKPADYLATFRLAQALRTSGALEDAELASQTAADIKNKRERFSKLHQDATARPQDAKVRYELGELATELDMSDLAITWYQAALELDPKHLQAKEKLDALRPPQLSE